MKRNFKTKNLENLLEILESKFDFIERKVRKNIGYFNKVDTVGVKISPRSKYEFYTAIMECVDGYFEQITLIRLLKEKVSKEDLEKVFKFQIFLKEHINDLKEKLEIRNSIVKNKNIEKKYLNYLIRQLELANYLLNF